MIFIIYDLEATCWRGRPPKGVNEIIEIGAVKVNRYGELLGNYESFIKPLVNPLLSDFCKQLTSIQQHNVDSAPLFNKVIEDFKDWIFEEKTEYLLCSWGSFDKQFIINDCNLHKLDHSWLDNNYTDLKGQYSEIKKLEKHKGLKAAVKLEGFEFTGVHHRAISDAENLAKIFIKYVDEWMY